MQTSGSFLPFQNEKLGRNESRLDGDRSPKLAKALRNATRPGSTLFGNDVRTAYQLLAHVLQHESRQQGFDLAATRDADFHEVGDGDQSLWRPLQMRLMCSWAEGRRECAPCAEGKVWSQLMATVVALDIG